MENSNIKMKFGTKQLVLIGMLAGISIFMGLTGLGMLPTPWMKVTIQHIPVIIGGIVGGPIVGASVGLLFGLSSIYQNMIQPVLLSPIFMNPIISIIPRVLIGLVSYYSYNFIKNKFNKEKTAITIAAILGTITNTAGVLGFTYLFALNQFAALKEISPSTVGAALGGIVVTNGIPEVIVSVLIVVPVVTTLFKINRKK